MTALDDAIRHAKAITVKPERIQELILTGRYTRDSLMRAEWWKALTSLYAAAHPAPMPVPPTPAVDPYSQYVVFCAQEPQTALAAPAKYCIAFSADKAYRTANLVDIVAQARGKGHRVAGWCDCRPAPDGTPASAGVQFVTDYGLDYFIGQAESAAEFDDAVSAGAKVVVGNLTALTADQQQAIRDGRVSFQQEDYWNEGWARAQSPLISAYIAGVYPALWAPTIAAYQQAGRWRDGDGVYYSATVTDWQHLP